MFNSRELLNNSGFQDFMIKNAEKWFSIERLLREPSVIFDRGNEDFWTTITNSQKKDQIFQKIKDGYLIPINADMLSDIATVHTAFHVYLGESGKNIPIIPTIVNVGGRIGHIGDYIPPKEIPGVYIKKTCFMDGMITSHRGEGVSVVRITEDNLINYLPKNHWEFLQMLIVPPDDFIRDIRAFVVGGRTVEGVIRRARTPLRPENLKGEVLPTFEQFPSAKVPGPSFPLKETLRDKIFSQADTIIEVLDKKIKNRIRPFSPHSTFGFGSIDFLLDANSTPLPVDFDINPSVTKFEGIDKKVGEKLANFLHRLANIDGIERKVVLIGSKDDKLLEAVKTELKHKITSQKLVFQEPILDRAIRELKK